ncbi:MAG TPA: HPF/RaiA family ribosome-associated protein [Candidatus Sulfotelmatobacter sp.]|nr:HPF/RaiA family ribosome-associated protein [Candidatus Sulfotelmatobacter sp.]
MRLEIRIQKVDLPKEVERYIARRLQFCLGRFDVRIRSITVRIFDINGPRGGADKRCRVAVHLIPSGVIVVEEVHADLFAAIDRCTERAGQALARKLHRARDLRTQRESVRIVPEPREHPAERRRAA